MGMPPISDPSHPDHLAWSEKYTKAQPDDAPTYEALRDRVAELEAQLAAKPKKARKAVAKKVVAKKASGKK